MHFTIFDLLLERVPALYVIFLFSSLFLSIHPLQPHPPPYFLLCSCNSCALGTLSKTEKKREGGWHPCRYYMDRNTYFVLKKSRRFIPTGWFHCFGSSQTRSTDTFQCMFDVFFLLWEGGRERNKRNSCSYKKGNERRLGRRRGWAEITRSIWNKQESRQVNCNVRAVDMRHKFWNHFRSSSKRVNNAL